MGELSLRNLLCSVIPLISMSILLVYPAQALGPVPYPNQEAGEEDGDTEADWVEPDSAVISDK